MTEQEWETSTDPATMVEYLHRWPENHRVIGHKNFLDWNCRYSDRLLRLFACACVRQCWGLLVDERSRKAVEVSERFADGKATEEERAGAERDSVEAMPMYLAGCPQGMTAADYPDGWPQMMANFCVWADRHLPYVARRITEVSVEQADKQAALLRKIIGNVFSPLTLPAGRTPQVVALATAAFDQRERECGCKGECYECSMCHGSGIIVDGSLDQQRLDVLSDALEDAGCSDEPLLRELRGFVRCSLCYYVPPAQVRWDYDDDSGSWSKCNQCEGSGWVKRPVPTYRGFWVLDLLLGKE